MFGFFCTTAKLLNRYVEVVPGNNSIPADYHEVNEVYLTEIKKWIMIDVTGNILSIYKNHQPVSAAIYLDYMLQKQNDTFSVIRSDSISFHTETLLKGKFFPDNYFNQDHFLRYYHTMNLSEAYGSVPKIKRYIFADPWYEMYDSQKQHSNVLFRIKQSFIVGLMVCVVLFFYEARFRR